MRRVVLIIPHLLSSDEGESVLRSGLPGISRIAEQGRIFRLTPLPGEHQIVAEDIRNLKGLKATVTPEAAMLGMDPTRIVLQDGPFTVAALGADPPARSVHFHLSLMSFEGGLVKPITISITPEDQEQVIAAARKLNTRLLTVVEGEGRDHGLVWEDGSLDLGVVDARWLSNKPPQPYLPEGEGEPMLRRFIDDSVNILSELPLNRIREEEGQPLLNLLWPWGPGFREFVPNLALTLGLVPHVESGSMRLQGLSRLCGFRHGNRCTFGRGVRVNAQQILGSVSSREVVIVLIDAFTLLREPDRPDQMEWLLHRLDAELVLPLLELGVNEPIRISLLAPGGFTGTAPPGCAATGLGAEFDSRAPRVNAVPFSEEAIQDRNLAKRDLSDVVLEQAGPI